MTHLAPTLKWVLALSIVQGLVVVARKKVKTLFESDGVLGEHMIQLSRARSEQVGGVRATSIANFESAIQELDAGEGDACVVFMTSHGTESGFLIRREGYLVPTKLDQILDDACGDLPTVALISACYSGMFVEPLNAPNSSCSPLRDRIGHRLAAINLADLWSA